jgi:hypothetical protein
LISFALQETEGNRAVVPSFFHQEVLNALPMGERRKRITTEATQAASSWRTC